MPPGSEGQGGGAQGQGGGDREKAPPTGEEGREGEGGGGERKGRGTDKETGRRRPSSQPLPRAKTRAGIKDMAAGRNRLPQLYHRNMRA